MNKHDIGTKHGKYKAGDWIRFYQNGTMVIGVVQYTWEETGATRYLGTDVGTVCTDDVLEHRPA